MGLGNPGPEYDATRHNVGWWVLDRLAHDWGFDFFRRAGKALLTEGTVGAESVRLLKPRMYMNRSGLALRELRDLELSKWGGFAFAPRGVQVGTMGSSRFQGRFNPMTMPA
jgi:hypothetical protein